MEHHADNLAQPASAVDPGAVLDAAYRRLADGPAGDAAFAEAVLAARPMILPRKRATLEAAEDALIDEAMRIVLGESTYDPAKLRLVPFLRMVVRKKVLNHLRGVQRRRKHEATAARLENNPDLVASDDPPGNGLAEAEFESAKLDAVQAVLGEADFRFLKAVRAGEPTEALAVVLGGEPGRGGGESGDDVKAAVRRAVDRITKRLRRKGLIP